MRDNDKRKSTTFQRIMENNPENIFAQSDARIKERHGGFTINLSKNLSKIENKIKNDSPNPTFDGEEGLEESDDDSLNDDSD